jgi:AraC family transcriptional regulator
MTNKDIILKALQFIEANLENEISVMDIAGEACYSLYHFIRLFQSITGYSPGNYLQQRRLTEAVSALRSTELKISDIAYRYQFGSPEAFTRAFRRMFHHKPSHVRTGKLISTFPLVYPISADFIYQSEKVRNEPPDLVILDKTFLIGIAFFIEDDAKIHSLAKEWGEFMNELDRVKNKIEPHRFYQVQYWSEDQELGGMYFFIGIEVFTVEDINPHFVVKMIPHGKYLRFIHKGLANKVGYTYKYIYNQYLPDTDHRLTKPFNFELYGERCLGPDNEKSESEIYIPVE